MSSYTSRSYIMRARSISPSRLLPRLNRQVVRFELLRDAERDDNDAQHGAAVDREHVDHGEARVVEPGVELAAVDEPQRAAQHRGDDQIAGNVQNPAPTSARKPVEFE